MQTFLPYPDVRKSLECLDRKRLGCQRKEAKQILDILQGKSEGWKNHPAVLMWRGYEGFLQYYYNCSLFFWEQRGYQNIKLKPTYTFKPRFPLIDFAGSEYFPYWFNNKEFHDSHKSNLLRKDPDFYSQYNWKVPPDLPYFWPKPIK